MSDGWYAFLGSEVRDRNRTDLLIAADPRYDVLMETLALAVPLRIWELQDRTPEQRAAVARRCGQVVAEHGDALMFKSGKGATAQAFNALAEGLAAASFQPGGVTFAGRHWCTDHGRCERAAAGLPDEPHPDAAVAPEHPRVESVAPAGEWADAL